MADKPANTKPTAQIPPRDAERPNFLQRPFEDGEGREQEHHVSGNVARGSGSSIQGVHWLDRDMGGAPSTSARQNPRYLPRKPGPEVEDCETEEYSTRLEMKRKRDGIESSEMEQDVLSDIVNGGEDRQEAHEYQGSAEHPVVNKIPAAHEGEELGAQSFLVSTDLISGAEIIAMVRALNANVFQTAALMADTLECALVDGMPRGEPAARLGFGDTIKRLLASADSAAVQIALQTAIARWCKQKIESWCLKDRRLSHHLSGLYEKIWHTETQATAGRWRALTRANTQRSDEESLLTNSLIDWVFDVMLAAGWNIEDAEGIASLEERFGGQISAIVKYSLQLRKAIGEDMVSEEFEVLFIEPNRTFDGKTMEDAEAIRRTDETPINQVAFEVVACTNDIGLQRRSRNGNLESTGVLLRPNVFLESAFQEI